MEVSVQLHVSADVTSVSISSGTHWVEHSLEVVAYR
jgi:hypothetical protein